MSTAAQITPTTRAQTGHSHQRLHCTCPSPRVANLGRERQAPADDLDLRPQLRDARESLNILLEVHELLAVLLLDLPRKLAAAVQEPGNLDEVVLLHAARGHGR